MTVRTRVLGGVEVANDLRDCRCVELGPNAVSWAVMGEEGEVDEGVITRILDEGERPASFLVEVGDINHVIDDLDSHAIQICDGDRSWWCYVSADVAEMMRSGMPFGPIINVISYEVINDDDIRLVMVEPQGRSMPPGAPKDAVPGTIRAMVDGGEVCGCFVATVAGVENWDPLRPLALDDGSGVAWWVCVSAAVSERLEMNAVRVGSKVLALGCEIVENAGGLADLRVGEIRVFAGEQQSAPRAMTRGVLGQILEGHRPQPAIVELVSFNHVRDGEREVVPWWSIPQNLGGFGNGQLIALDSYCVGPGPLGPHTLTVRAISSVGYGVASGLTEGCLARMVAGEAVEGAVVQLRRRNVLWDGEGGLTPTWALGGGVRLGRYPFNYGDRIRILEYEAGAEGVTITQIERVKTESSRSSSSSSSGERAARDQSRLDQERDEARVMGIAEGRREALEAEAESLRRFVRMFGSAEPTTALGALVAERASRLAEVEAKLREPLRSADYDWGGWIGRVVGELRVMLEPVVGTVD